LFSFLPLPPSGFEQNGGQLRLRKLPFGLTHAVLYDIRVKMFNLINGTRKSFYILPPSPPKHTLAKENDFLDEFHLQIEK
jgi:hypothetical protein